MARTTEEKISNTQARNQAWRTRLGKLRNKIANATDPAVKAQLQAKYDSIFKKLQAGKARVKDLKGTLNIEGVTGATNLAAAESFADKYTPTLDRVQTGILGYDPTTGNPIRIGENKEVLDRYRSVMEKGMEAPEYQAEREQMSKGLTSDYRTAQSELAKAQARGKVYGAAAGAQASNLARADSEKRADLEQQLFLKGTQLKRDYLDKYSGALAGMQDYEMQASKVNLGQSNAEEAARISLLTNMIGAGMGKDYNQQAFELSNKALDAANEPLELPTVKTGTKEPENTSTTGGSQYNTDPNNPVNVTVNKDAATIAKLRARNRRLKNRLSGAKA